MTVVVSGQERCARLKEKENKLIRRFFNKSFMLRCLSQEWISWHKSGARWPSWGALSFTSSQHTPHRWSFWTTTTTKCSIRGLPVWSLPSRHSSLPLPLPRSVSPSVPGVWTSVRLISWEHKVGSPHRASVHRAACNTLLSLSSLGSSGRKKL